MVPLKILIVDDEPSIRDMVSGFLKGDAVYAVAGEAIDGEMALEFLSREMVDIILTDLRMPVMDGLELIQRVGTMVNPPNIVVLSAYNEFPLVKEAFKLGICDYLLKSEITSDELRCVLDGLRHRLRSGNENRSVPPGDILRDLASGFEESSWEAVSKMGYRLDKAEASFQALVVEVFIPLSRLENVNFRDGGIRGASSFRISGFCERVGELAAGKYAGSVRSTVSGPATIVLLCAANRTTPLESMASAVFMLIKDTAGESGFEVAGGVSERSAEADHLHELFLHASVAKERYYLERRGKLYRYGDEAEIPDQPRSMALHEKIENLRKLVASKNGCQIKAQAPCFAIHPAEFSLASAKVLRSLFKTYHSILSDAVAAEGKEACPELTRMLDDYEYSLVECGTLEESNRWIRLALVCLGENLFSRSSVVRAVLAYILAHYSGEVHLSHLAGHLGVSEAHISRQFSREMKCSFIAYLSKFRMEKAAELLRTTNLKIYEIAERTGYPNTEHFSRTFKKVMGRSPKGFH